MSKDTDRDAQRCPNDGQTLAWHLETDRDGRTNGAFLGCAFGAPSLPVFLLARLDEDEAAAKAAMTRRGSVVYTDARRGGKQATLAHITRHDPARVLADVEAKRRIVEHHAPLPDEFDLCAICTEVGPEAQLWPCYTLRLLALPYADHEDYLEEWKP